MKPIALRKIELETLTPKRGVKRQDLCPSYDRHRYPSNHLPGGSIISSIWPINRGGVISGNQREGDMEVSVQDGKARDWEMMHFTAPSLPLDTQVISVAYCLKSFSPCSFRPRDFIRCNDNVSIQCSVERIATQLCPPATH